MIVLALPEIIRTSFQYGSTLYTWIQRDGKRGREKGVAGAGGGGLEGIEALFLYALLAAENLLGSLNFNSSIPLRGFFFFFFLHLAHPSTGPTWGWLKPVLKTLYLGPNSFFKLSKEPN